MKPALALREAVAPRKGEWILEGRRRRVLAADGLILVLLLIFPFVVSSFWVDIGSKLLAFALFALSVELVWGQFGLFTFGHAALFGTGGYIVALLSEHTTDAGVRVNNGWWGVSIVAVPIAMVGAALLAFVVSLLLLAGRRPLVGVGFALATLAVAYLASQLTSSSGSTLGGYNGIAGLPGITFTKGGEQITGGFDFYWIALGCLGVFYILLRGLWLSRLGVVMRGTRQTDERIRFLGFNTNALRIGAFTLSGALAGLAGSLFAFHEALISPDQIGFEFSGAVLIWVMVGGRGTLGGAVVGAFAVNATGSLLSDNFQQLWQVILAGILVFIVLAFPGGLTGWLYGLSPQRSLLSRLRAGELRLPALLRGTARAPAPPPKPGVPR